LDIWKQANRNFLINKRMPEFFAFSQLPFCQHCFSGILFKNKSPGFFLKKIVWLKLTAIDQGQRKTICHEYAKLFH